MTRILSLIFSQSNQAFLQSVYMIYGLLCHFPNLGASGSKKTKKLSIFIEDLSRNSVFFWTEVKP